MKDYFYYSSDTSEHVVTSNPRQRRLRKMRETEANNKQCGQTIRLPMKWFLFILSFAFSVVLINEIAFPHFNLLPMKSGLDISTVLALPEENNIISFTSVGFKGCKDFNLNHKLLEEVEAFYNAKHSSSSDSEFSVRSVEIPSKSEFDDWLNRRQAANQIPLYHLTSPVNFVTIGGHRSFIGGLDEVLNFIESDRVHFRGFSLDKYKGQLVKRTENEVVNDDFYEQKFKDNYVDTSKDLLEKSNDMREIRRRGISSKVKQIIPQLEKQVDLSKRQNILVTTFRKNPEKAVTNYRLIWKYLVSKGWSFKGRAPNLASLIVVQDQASAAQALKYKNTLVNNIGYGGQSCYGGSKGAQLRCRMELAAKHGCNYDDLKIQPPQYRFWKEEECTTFFDNVCDTISEDGTRITNPPRLWIEKPNAGQHGVGMKVHKGCEEMRKRWGKCSKGNLRQKKWFVMEYIDPALLDGHKFDLRTFLLVASLDPLLVFHHDGFVRRAGTAYDSDLSDTKAHITNAHSQDGVEDHFWDFERLENYLHQEHGFPEDYMRTNFKNHALKIENFVFQAARANMFRYKGAFQVFALDWIIDSSGGIHMLEANSNPLVTSYPINGYPDAWHSMMDLILLIHSSPEDLKKPLITVPNSKRFSYNGWDLIFNENEEQALGLEYNTCKSLDGLNQEPFAADIFDENILLEEIQKRLNIEENMLHDLAKLDVEDNEIEEEVVKNDDTVLSLSPKDQLANIIASNQPRNTDFDREAFQCEELSDFSTSGSALRCIMGAKTSFETFFYVFDPPATTKSTYSDMPTVLVVSGLHGNEPSGVVAARVLRKDIRLTSARLVVIERLHSSGVLRSQRYLNGNKLDPNRVFPDSFEVEPKGEFGKLVWEVISTFKPDVFFDLHEGWGIYSALKDNPNPSGKLVGNNKFSKGSSIITVATAKTLVDAVLNKMNDVTITKELLSTLREELRAVNKDDNDVFLANIPPISGGLAQRVHKFYGSLSFVQETTSRQGNQPLATRALQHLALFALTMKELELGVYTQELAEQCNQETTCIVDSGIEWIFSLNVPNCVAGRNNCNLKHPDDKLVSETKKQYNSVLSELENALADFDTTTKLEDQ